MPRIKRIVSRSTASLSLLKKFACESVCPQKRLRPRMKIALRVVKKAKM